MNNKLFPGAGGTYGNRVMRQTMNEQAKLTGGYGSGYGNQSMNGMGSEIRYPQVGGKKINEDRLWQVYSDQALYGGQLAMQDAIGQNTAQTGGYGNSYATQAAGNAYMDYINQLNQQWEPLYREKKTGGGRSKAPGPKAPNYTDPHYFDFLTRIQPQLEEATQQDAMDQMHTMTRDQLIKKIGGKTVDFTKKVGEREINPVVHLPKGGLLRR